jgi:hypothetical protein
MRLLVAMLATVLPAGALFTGTCALAQTPPDVAPTVVIPDTPNTAFQGTLAGVSGRHATLQTADGHTLQIDLRPGYLLVNSSSHPLSSGQRVYVSGPTNSDGSVTADEVDVLIPANLLSF